jgi:hypothetical protein
VDNPSGRTGRDGEHQANAYLVMAGFQMVDREGGRAPSLDNVADDLTTPIETKRQATISLPEWVRKVVSVHGKERWGLFVIRRDARKTDGLPVDVVVFPATFGARLLKLYEETEGRTNGQADV